MKDGIKRNVIIISLENAYQADYGFEDEEINS